jgi:hypothetical protein
MRHTVGILSFGLEVGLEILLVKSPYVTASLAAGRVVVVFAGNEVATMVDNDWVRCVEAATVIVGTKSAELA